MGCGASHGTQDESHAKKTPRESAAVESCSTQARVNRSGTIDAAPGTASPNANNSLSPGSGALSSSAPNLNNSFSSSINSQSMQGIAMPTHTIVDGSGHKVSSCISSRSKVDTVTRWLDHIIRHRYDNGGWKNPQDEPPKEKEPKEARPPFSTASQGSVASDSVTRMAGSPTMENSTASASQLSLGVPMTPGGEGASTMVHRPMSTTPFSPWSDISNQNESSPADRQLEWHTPHGNGRNSTQAQTGSRPPEVPTSPQRSSLQGQPVAVAA